MVVDCGLLAGALFQSDGRNPSVTVVLVIFAGLLIAFTYRGPVFVSRRRRSVVLEDAFAAKTRVPKVRLPVGFRSFISDRTPIANI
jgi:hypothetical protein